MAQTEATIRTLDRIFNARAVAVVGASNDPAKFGYMTMNSILSGGYEGALYPINPKGGEILGRKVYTSLADLPQTPDLAAIIIPAQMVPGVVLEAAKLGIPGAMIMSGGFREAGRADLEAEIGAISREYGIRILGPNIQGINYLPNKLCAMFLPVIKTRGPLAVITQSGSVTAALIEWAADEGLGISAAVNLGNQVDLCESDYIDFFAQDENTKAIVLYLESVKNGRRFLNTVKQAVLKKPVCILKTGRTAEGKKAAASHTGSLAGNFEVFSAVCRQLGVFCADDLEHLYDGAKALAAVRPPQGNRLMFITTSGGAATLASDLVKEAGLILPALSEELVSELKTSHLPALAILSNPLDMAGGILAEYFERSVLAADRRGAADIYFLSFADPVAESAEMLQRVAPQLQGSLAVLYMGGGEQEKIGRVKMHQAGFPVFPTPERAMRGLAAVMAIKNFKAKSEADKPAGLDYVWNESKPQESEAKPVFVLEPEAARRLAEFNIPYPEHALAADPDQAA
ncbi:MAG: CoA-binding protein, partial [Pseudomonadota bacterium]